MRAVPVAAAVVVAALLGTAARAASDDEEKQWLEGEVTLPAYPQEADLMEFYVSAATANRFFIDGKSLSVGNDGVVRYTLVVLTAGGATNVSHEGMRCEVRQLRLYATGRADRSWAASRVAEWRAVENKPVNRHHAALSRDYFCPGGTAIRSAAEGRDALRRGKHPEAPWRTRNMAIDQLIIEFDKALRTVFAPAPTRRPMPGHEVPEADLGDAERRHAAALMRIDHCGEVCAQALYQGQALTSRDPAVKKAMEQAAWEETEHLNWTERRIAELGGHKSLLNPLWYAGSLAIGIAAGKLGDAWNLGFLAETERQVEAHLESHLAQLPAADRRSWAVLEQMKIDEIGHAETAVHMGARELPPPVKAAMKLSSKVMTTLAYRI